MISFAMVPSDWDAASHDILDTTTICPTLANLIDRLIPVSIDSGLMFPICLHRL